MKKILLLLGVLICVTAARVVLGQTTEGVITYEVKTNMHRRLPPEREGMKDMVPEFTTYRDQLFFNATESLYKSLEEDEDEFNDEGGGPRMRFRRPQGEHYYNQTTSQRILAQEFMGKRYLIEDSIKILPWKIGSEVKTIKGYECRQATYNDEERKQNIVAWYTDKIRPFTGPENFNSLPGAVIQVDINDGERIITMETIEARPLKKNELKAPSGGQRTTEKQFREMMEEQRKRMGGGGMIIRN